MEIEATTRLSTLGHPQRLAIFRLLMRRHPDRVPAGEIAQALILKPSTLSAYLSALMQAGLIEQRRDGTSLRYGVAMDAVRATFDYLFLDCCRGRPELCAPIPSSIHAGHLSMSDPRYNVLFLCTGNAARSIMAEAILRRVAGDRFAAFSAGTSPRPKIDARARDLLARNGHDTADLRTKDVSAFQGPDAPRFEFVFTVCDRAANEECPAWAGQPISGHWGMPDPVKAEGTAAQKALAFQQTYVALSRRIGSFAALPIATLDRVSLQRAVDDLARDGAGVAA